MLNPPPLPHDSWPVFLAQATCWSSLTVHVSGLRGLLWETGPVVGSGTAFVARCTDEGFQMRWLVFCVPDRSQTQAFSCDGSSSVGSVHSWTLLKSTDRDTEAFWPRSPVNSLDEVKGCQQASWLLNVEMCWCREDKGLHFLLLSHKTRTFSWEDNKDFLFRSSRPSV